MSKANLGYIARAEKEKEEKTEVSKLPVSPIEEWRSKHGIHRMLYHSALTKKEIAVY